VVQNSQLETQNPPRCSESRLMMAPIIILRCRYFFLPHVLTQAFYDQRGRGEWLMMNRYGEEMALEAWPLMPGPG
jgi:hypothetical protein